MSQRNTKNLYHNVNIAGGRRKKAIVRAQEHEDGQKVRSPFGRTVSVPGTIEEVCVERVIFTIVYHQSYRF